MNPRYRDGRLHERLADWQPPPEFPFLNNPIAPDPYARIITRRFYVDPRRYTPRIARRTSYSNWLTYSADLANAAWASVSGGTGTAASFALASDAGPDGGLCYRLLANRGAGNTSADFSGMEQSVSGLSNPHNVGAAVWLKSNTGAEQVVQLYTAAGAQVAQLVVATEWRRFSLGVVSHAATTDAFRLWTRGGEGTTASLDILVALPVLGVTDGTPAISTTAASRTISAPDVDAIANPTAPDRDWFAYLVYESEKPQREGDRWVIERRYARIPATQTTYPGSSLFSLPTPANQYGAVSSLTAVDMEYQQSLGAGHYQGALYTTGDSKLYRAKSVVSFVSGRATGGTFTITYGSDTTAALAYNASGVTIQSAINALASVSADGLTTSVGNLFTSTGVLTINIGITGSIPSGWPKKFTLNAGSLGVTTSQNPTTIVETGNQQQIFLPDHLTISGHGFDTAKRLAAVNTNKYLLGYPSGFWGSIDANTIWVPTGASYGFVYAGDYVREYSPAVCRLRRRMAAEFYLPGVTAGISTPADIAPSAGLANDVDLLFAIASLSGWQVYESEGPSPWLGFSIHQLIKTSINIDDT